MERFPSAEAFLFQYEERKDFDILLLDVEMGEVNGIELAQRIRLEDSRVQIVFITGFPDFMAEGYEVAALHYLMKPVSREKLCAVLDRAAANLARPGKRLQVNFDRETCFVPFDRILYIEAQKQFVRIHTESGDHRMKASLSEMEAALDEYFFKCQRSFLVNLNHVARIRNQCAVLKNGEEIPISLPANLDMNDVDLCVVIGNLMDNAIEENGKLDPEKRFIRIYIGVKNTQLYIAVTNAAGKKREKAGGLFRSSKGSQHGFGLARVEAIVKKYDGIFTADSEDGGFTAEVLIPIGDSST